MDKKEQDEIIALRDKQLNNGGRTDGFHPVETPLRVARYLEACLIQKRLPTSAGLAGYVGVSRDSIWRWGKKYPHFSDLLRRFNDLKEDILIHRAMNGQTSVEFAKFMLKNQHGYVDRTDLVNSINTDPQTYKVGDKVIEF